MAQHDYVIANGTGAAVRSDINNALAAIVSQNSGSTEPATTYAYMMWPDTTAGVMKMRNGANSAWITLYQLDGEWSTIAFENGTAAAPSIYFKDSGTDTGFYSPGANQVGISTGGTAALVIDSSQRVGLGTSSPGYSLTNTSDHGGTWNSTGSLTWRLDTANYAGNFVNRNTSGVAIGLRIHTQGATPANDYGLFVSSGSGNGTANFVVTGDGKVGIGSTAPNRKLEVSDASVDNFIRVNTTGATKSGIEFASGGTVYSQLYFNNVAPYDLSLLQQYSTGSVILGTNNTERARIDSSGRLLVGTSSSDTSRFGTSTYNPGFQVKGTWPQSSASITSTNDYPALWLNGTAGTTAGSGVGIISFNGYDGSNYTQAATIKAEVDGSASANDMPGRLVFSTCPDGSATPVERARIGSNGSFSIGGNAGTNDWRLFVVGSSNTNTTYAAVVRNSDTSDLFFIRNDGGFSTGTAPASPYYVTTASAANVFITSAGYLQRSTSSARYKKDIETLENHYADAILNARPVWYKSIASGDTIHPEWGYWGFIAEEVAEIDPRLVFWKTHETEKDEDGNTVQVELEKPIAEGVQYDRFVPHLLNLIKRQGEAIAELQAEVAALKGA